MKKIVAKYILLISLLLPFSAQAQLFVGIHGGQSYSSMEPGVSPKYKGVVMKYRPGISYGAHVGYMTKPALGVKLELNYVQKGWKVDTLTQIQNAREINYFEIPIVSHFEVGKKNFKLLVELGFFTGYALSSYTEYLDENDQEIREKYELDSSKDNFIDYGATAGLGIQYRLPFGAISLSGRYTMGFADIIKDKAWELELRQTRAITATLSYSYYFNRKDKSVKP